MAMHCTPCLSANHRGCKIMLPLEWGDDTGRCVCKCSNRDASRLCNVERISEERAAKAPKPPRPERKSRKGTPLGATKWTEAAIRQLCELDKAGLTSRQIGVEVGAHMDTVRTYLARARKLGWR